MIHYISAFDPNKNIGGALNKAIAQLNADDNDWICSTDMDVLWLRNDSKSQLETILNNTDYDLLGPLTNRLGTQNQLIPNVFNEDSITRHVEIAKERHDIAYGEIMPYNKVLAALCLCFRVKTWKLLGGFSENNIVFDTDFCRKSQQHKLKSGLMIGIYVFHLYRWGSPSPSIDIKHLLP